VSARSSERSGSLERNANEYAESIGVLWPGCVDDLKSKECEVPRELPKKSVRRARDLYPVYELEQSRTGGSEERTSELSCRSSFLFRHSSIISGYTRCMTRGYSPFVPSTRLDNNC
jgi:hypothetical protein